MFQLSVENIICLEIFSIFNLRNIGFLACFIKRDMLTKNPKHYTNLLEFFLMQEIKAFS